MRLINVKTLELKQFHGSQTPPYAILSHTWDGDNEVTFQEWERRTDNAVKRKSGYAKIVGACRRAQADGYQYLWCDTNCIDKSSSAELSEAINSMFAWYHDSAVCYAYLADVQAKTGTFSKSRWYTRGWTLQELLAPSKVIFFDCHWTVLGDRGELAGIISGITRIHIGALEDHSTIHSYSIAQRMSWAADRETSRLEDIAYCLLGIFNINMPLLYGEGTKAFNRLQQEITKVSDDQSILAWSLRHSAAQLWAGALAQSPTEFRFCGSIVRSDEIQYTPYAISNLGIHMSPPLIKTLIGGLVLVGLNCAKELHRMANHSNIPGGIQVSRHFQIWILLYRLRHNIYLRIHHPSSIVFLGHLYPTLRRSTPTNLFLSLDASQAPIVGPLEASTHILQRRSSIPYSGSLIMVAAGNTAPRSSILREAYPLNNVSITQLKCRKNSAVSHQLITSGDISIIFSVFWDQVGLPQEWLYTTIYDPKQTSINQIASQTEWDCLFEADDHVQSLKCCDSPTAMHSIHEKLRQMQMNLPTIYEKEEWHPLITVETQHLLDSLGQIELIVEVIFREPPRFINV